jgi:vancomycin resistance protein YoaR
MTTLTALTRPRLLFAAGPIRRGLLTGFLATLIVGAMILIGASGSVALSHADRVMPGVTVAGIPIGGLARADAIARLESQLPTLAGGSLTLRVDGSLVEVPYDRLGVAYDLDATVDAAFGVARSGNPLADGVARLRAVARPTAVSGVALTHDPAAMEALVGDIAERFDREAADATVKLTRPASFRVTPAVDGLAVDRSALSQAIAAALADAPRSGVSLDVSVTRTAPSISTAQAMYAAASAFRMSSSPLKLTGGGESRLLRRSALAGAITFGATDDAAWGASVDRKAVRKLLRPVATEVARAPRDASFIYGPDGIVGVIAGQSGRELNLKASEANVVAALEQRAAGSSKLRAALAIGVAQPMLTTKEARKVAPVMRPISSWTTFYDPGEGNFWGANISIPAQDLDGMVVAPGEWFDFWEDIGPVTVERGYGYGGVIIGGRSVANGALGGGICSTSTTLFNAAMRAGLEIGQRVNHSYYIERYPVGLDATVLKTDTYTTSMQFRNDTDDPIVIRSYTGYGFVRFDIWGVPNGRTVTLSTAVKSNYRTASTVTVVNPDLRPGTSVQVEWPHDGFDTSVTRWVRDAEGNLIHEDIWFSHYNMVNGVIEVGPKPSSN